RPSPEPGAPPGSTEVDREKAWDRRNIMKQEYDYAHSRSYYVSYEHLLPWIGLPSDVPESRRLVSSTGGMTGMDNLTRKGLESLAARAADVCVSIYLPTRRAGMGKPQGAIRLKNHLKRAV